MQPINTEKWQRILASIGMGIAFGIPMAFLYDNWLAQLSGFIGTAVSMATSMYIVFSAQATKKKRGE